MTLRRVLKEATDSGEKAGKKPGLERWFPEEQEAALLRVAALDRSGAHGDAAAQQAAQDRHLEEGAVRI